MIHWKPKNLRHNCFIGVKCLYENQTEGYVRDQDLAFCVKHLMHETRHLYQNQVLYQEPLIGFSLDMAKMDALSSYFSGYRQNMYEVLPSELDAEIHGLLDTVAFFDQIIDENGEKILDAKTCLENCYFERRNFRIYSPYDEKIVPFDNIIRILQEQQAEYKAKDRGFPFDSSNAQDQANLEHLKKYSDWISILNRTDPTSGQYDDVLFAVMLDLNPRWAQTHIGIQDYAKQIQEQYPPRIPSVGKQMLTDITFVFKDEEEICLTEDYLVGLGDGDGEVTL